ncbi:oocyte zinc finger protein XlCOF6-like [Topomyia yanbarensis]|uniref:oocyte zinc finger protein XlCOF6-like n=1 Tax=Topomyia yanbarensis TaxID=2498891 RepID=UPI00273CCA35|nr:oocyte zinc finger protein XlCOF6-like [Topomyia yanbarensis]
MSDQFVEVCRICVESGHFLFALYGGDNTKGFVEIIEQIANITLDPNDGLPVSICGRCVRDVEATKELIERCRTSDECLRRKLGLNTHVIQEFEVGGENSSIQLIEVCGVTSEQGIAFNQVEIVDINDIIEEELFEPTDLISESSEEENENIKAIESSYVNDLIVTDPTALVAEAQESNYTQCCGCVEHFDTYEALQNHSQLCHLEDKGICGPVPDNLIECVICYKLFSGVAYLDSMHRLNAFKYRLQSVGFPKVMQCCTCDFKASSKDELLRHSEEHIGQKTHEDPNKPFECEFCFKRYKEKPTLNFHQRFSHSYKKQLVNKRRGCRAVKKRTEIESATDSRKCCGCSAEFLSLDSLKQHSRMHHDLYRSQIDSANPFECEICFKRFPTLVRLEQHRLVPYIREHKCDECAKTFLTLPLLQKHMQNHNSSKKGNDETPRGENVLVEKNVQCDLCGKTVKDKYQLKAHQKSKHSQDKPFNCSLCFRQFKWKHALQNHLRVHTKEQPYGCKYCPKKFTQLTDKNRHESSHSQKFPLQCLICGKGFSAGRQKSLEKHEKLHQAGEDYPFTCRFCDRTFTRLSHRDRHQARHAAE